MSNRALVQVFASSASQKQLFPKPCPTPKRLSQWRNPRPSRQSVFAAGPQSDKATYQAVARASYHQKK